MRRSTVLVLVLVRAFAAEAAFRSGVVVGVGFGLGGARSPGIRTVLPSSSSEMRAAPSLDDDEISPATTLHTVNGVLCREVTNELPVIGTVRVLEATADSQEELVDECLHLHEDDDYDYDDDLDDYALPAKRIARGDPYGAVLWPAAWAVSNYILTDPGLRDALPSTAVLELGSGTGLVSVSTALAGARRVLATDYEPLALDLTRYAAENLNGDAPIGSVVATELLDLRSLHEPLPIASLRGDGDDDEPDAPVLVVAADVMYEPATGAAVAHRVVEALRQGCRVLVGDSPGRPGRPAFLQTLRELGVDRSIEFGDAVGRTCTGPRNDLICGEGSTSVSATPEELSVALIDLRPDALLR